MLYRFVSPNATLDKSCNIQSIAGGVKGIALVNESHVWVNNDAGNSVWYINMNDCSEVTEYLGKLPSKYTTGYVNRRGIDDHFVYYGSGHILDETANVISSTANWGVDNGGLSLIKFNLNDTAWVGEQPLNEKSGNVIKEWTISTETETGQQLNISRVFNTDAISFSIVKTGTDTWIYWFEQGSSSSKYNLYRGNFTAGLESAGAFFNFDIANNSIINAGDRCLNVLLTSDLNGTLLWFVNDTNVFNSSVTTAPVTDLPLQYCLELDSGSYEWRTTFIDTGSISWISDTIVFFTEEPGIIPYISGTIGNVLGLNLEGGKVVLALFLILIISTSTALKFGKGGHIYQVFISTSLITLFIFWYIEMIPTIIIIPVILGIGLLFANGLKNLVLGG